VAEICRRLDGLPLAIELAAVRASVLGVDEVARRLDRRFELLTRGARTAPPRHRALRAALDWSYDRLPETERVTFRRLAVFESGWSLEAAETVCGTQTAVRSGDGASAGPLPYAYRLLPAEAVLDALAQLVDKSLVLAETDAGGAARYRLLETVRQYALEQLAEVGEEAATRARHAAWGAGRAEAAGSALHAAEHGASRSAPAGAAVSALSLVPESSSRPLGRLTARERDVLWPLARGRSNPQIAAELSIGVRTVETHVAHILGKLDLGSRYEVAPWLHDSGLAATGRA
jgi:predicted ATPase